MPHLARGPVRGASRPSLPAFQRAVNCISGVEKPGQGVFLETEAPEGSGRAARPGVAPSKGSWPQAQAARPATQPSRKGEKPMRQRPHGSRSRRQCGVAGAARPHVLRAWGGHAQPALATWPPAPLRPGAQDPALRTGGGQEKNQKLESLADLGPRRKGGHTGARRAENREILGRHT